MKPVFKTRKPFIHFGKLCKGPSKVFLVTWETGAMLGSPSWEPMNEEAEKALALHVEGKAERRKVNFEFVDAEASLDSLPSVVPSHEYKAALREARKALPQQEKRKVKELEKDEAKAPEKTEKTPSKKESKTGKKEDFVADLTSRLADKKPL